MSNKNSNEELQSRREFKEGVDFVWLEANANLKEAKNRGYNYVVVVTFDEERPAWNIAIINEKLYNDNSTCWIHQLVTQLLDKYPIGYKNMKEQLICLSTNYGQ